MQEITGIEAIKLWGTVCGKQGNCEKCPLQLIAGVGVSCQEFAKQFPQKFLSIIKEVSEGEISYYEEYCMRFPNCNTDIDTLSSVLCRKMVFEGYTLCTKSESECKACWKEKYVGDTTVTEEEVEKDIAVIEEKTPDSNTEDLSSDTTDILSNILNS